VLSAGTEKQTARQSVGASELARGMLLLPDMNTATSRDIKTLITFICVYCRQNHSAEAKVPAQLKETDLEALAGEPVVLCEACRKLLVHAVVKRIHCPMNPKPQCKHCPVHCYHPTYRAKIRDVMRFSGRWLVMRGRLHYLLHLLF
jgi:hypothetical protein